MIAGAAGGAYAGHVIEGKVRAKTVWSVRVRLDSGKERFFHFSHDPKFRKGERAKLSGNSIARA